MKEMTELLSEEIALICVSYPSVNQSVHLSLPHCLSVSLTFAQVSKIQAGEGFRVYLVIPLMPEGSVRNPVTRSSIKAILHYQFLTIQVGGCEVVVWWCGRGLW